MITKWFPETKIGTACLKDQPHVRQKKKKKIQNEKTKSYIVTFLYVKYKRKKKKELSGRSQRPIP